MAAPRLGATAAKAALSASGLSANQIEEAYVGSVLTAGVGQAPARQVALFSEFPRSVKATTVNKVCGSGLKAVTLAAERIQLGRSSASLAGGMENMSLVPYYSLDARAGLRMGNKTLVDGMVHDGLWDVYNQFHMGNAAELCAREFKFSREAQDAFATRSYARANKSIAGGLFKSEIAAVEIADKKEMKLIDTDEEPGRGKPEKFASLKPAFDKAGTITAANASSINDGAAMLILGDESLSKTAKPIGKILHHTEFAQAPEWFTTAPVACVRNLLAEASLKVSDIASFEINEAFAVVAMAAEKELQIPEEKLNPRGGAVALGHPIGASGARLLVTLLHTLERGQKGVASLCIGGGEAIAVLVERV